MSFKLDSALMYPKIMSVGYGKLRLNIVYSAAEINKINNKH